MQLQAAGRWDVYCQVGAAASDTAVLRSRGLLGSTFLWCLAEAGRQWRCAFANRATCLAYMAAYHHNALPSNRPNLCCRCTTTTRPACGQRWWSLMLDDRPAPQQQQPQQQQQQQSRAPPGSQPPSSNPSPHAFFLCRCLHMVACRHTPKPLARAFARSFRSPLFVLLHSYSFLPYTAPRSANCTLSSPLFPFNAGRPLSGRPSSASALMRLPRLPHNIRHGWNL